MTLDQRIAMYAARAAVNWRNGEEDQAAEWQAEVERLMDARDQEDLLRAAVRELMTTPSLFAGAREMALASLYASPGANRAVIDDEIAAHSHVHA